MLLWNCYDIGDCESVTLKKMYFRKLCNVNIDPFNMIYIYKSQQNNNVFLTWNEQLEELISLPDISIKISTAISRAKEAGIN